MLIVEMGGSVGENPSADRNHRRDEPPRHRSRSGRHEPKSNEWENTECADKGDVNKLVHVESRAEAPGLYGCGPTCFGRSVVQPV